MKKLLQRTLGMGVIVLVAASSYLVYANWLKKEPLPEGLIQANGRIEGDHVTVAAKYAGRIQTLLAREGDTVKSGQVLVKMEDPQMRARLEQANQAEIALEAQVKAARMNLEVLKKDVPLSIAAAEAGVAHARAVVANAEAKERQDRRDADRFHDLYVKGAADRHRSELADLARTVSTRKLVSAHTAFTQAEKQLAHAKLGWEKIMAEKENLAALKAHQKKAEAALAEARSVLEDFEIVAPSSGTITTRVADGGEVVVAGSPLFDLVDMDHLYLKVYVPENLIGKLRLGSPARIYTDAYPEDPFDAEVKYIAPRAEFTPKEVQTQDERVKLVYAAKLYLSDNPDHRLTPGMPADAVIRWMETVPWAKPQW